MNYFLGKYIDHNEKCCCLQSECLRKGNSEKEIVFQVKQSNIKVGHLKNNQKDSSFLSINNNYKPAIITNKIEQYYRNYSKQVLAPKQRPLRTNSLQYVRNKSNLSYHCQRVTKLNTNNSLEKWTYPQSNRQYIRIEPVTKASKKHKIKLTLCQGVRKVPNHSQQLKKQINENYSLLSVNGNSFNNENKQNKNVFKFEERFIIKKQHQTHSIILTNQQQHNLIHTDNIKNHIRKQLYYQLKREANNSNQNKDWMNFNGNYSKTSNSTTIYNSNKLIDEEERGLRSDDLQPHKLLRHNNYKEVNTTASNKENQFNSIHDAQSMEKNIENTAFRDENPMCNSFVYKQVEIIPINKQVEDIPQLKSQISMLRREHDALQIQEINLQTKKSKLLTQYEAQYVKLLEKKKLYFIESERRKYQIQQLRQAMESYSHCYRQQ